MADAIKVSSITYVKNGEKYIKKCIESIMKQTLKDIEIIVVDGGSNDDTLNIVNELKGKDKRIKLMNVKGSVGAQFNTALHEANGEYIAVCEGDDYIIENKYEVQYEMAHMYQLDVLRASYYLFFLDNGKEYRYKAEVSPMKDLYNVVMEPTLYNKFFVATFVNGYWNGLYSKKFLINNNIYQNETPGASFQDITFSFLSQLYARRYMFLSEPYHCYRIDNPNSSVNSSSCIEKLNIEYELLRKELLNRGLWDVYRQVFLAWEIGSYKQFLDRFSQEDKEKIIPEVYKKLLEQNVPKRFDDFSIYHKTKKIIDAFYSGEETFISAMQQKNSNIDKMLKFYRSEEYRDLTNIILFGAGHIGTIIYDFLQKSKKKIFIVDNNYKAFKNGFHGKIVHSPDLCYSNNYKIIIANVEHAMEIVHQLLENGVMEERIVVCDSEDVFLREVRMKININ